MNSMLSSCFAERGVADWRPDRAYSASSVVCTG